MLGLLPLWVILTWMVFPVLALAAETAAGVGAVRATTMGDSHVNLIGRLRPWPAVGSGDGMAGELGCGDGGRGAYAFERPSWRGNSDRIVPGRVLFVSVGFYGHAVPLLALAEEIAARGHNVTFGTHNHLRSLVEATPGVQFLSAGRMPMHDHQLRGKLKSLSQAGGFWGLLTLLNDVYLPLARPMHRALLAAVAPLTSTPDTPNSAPPPGTAPVGAEMTKAPPVANGPPGEKETAGQPGLGNGAIEEEFDFDRGTSGAHGCEFHQVGTDSSGEKKGSEEQDGACAAVDGGRDMVIDGTLVATGVVGEGGGGVHGMGEEDGGDQLRRRNESLSDTERADQCGSTRPFDLVVVDMASLGGLDFAQKLGIPYMFNSPSILFDLSGRHVTATLPGWGTGMSRQMSLGNRLQNAISPRALSVFLTPAFISMNKARREEGLEPFHAQDDVFHGARILVNTAFGLEYPHRLGPLVEMTGPLLPPNIARALSTPTPSSRPSLRPEQTARDSKTENGGGQRRSDELGPLVVRPTVTEETDHVGMSTRQKDDSSGVGLSSVDLGDDQGTVEDPLALPFFIRTWLGGTGTLVAPGTAAFESLMKQQQSRTTTGKTTTTGTATSSTGEGKGYPTMSGNTASDGDGQALPDDHGVIYVSLGRMPQLDNWQLVIILQALSAPSEAVCWGGGGGVAGGGGGRGHDDEDRLGKYRVLWAMTREQREQMLSALSPMEPPPSFRLKVMSGLPHLGILAHPSVKVVVSHCGMSAAQEALLFGKPLLCLPMLADQEDVARRVIDAGAGLSLSGLPTGNISAGEIRDAVADMVADPAFRSSAGVLSGVLRRAGGTLRAADVVEGTLQLGGGAHLHPPELRGPWHQTSSADAYGLLVAGVILLAVLGYAVFAAICYGVRLLILYAIRSLLRGIRWLLCRKFTLFLCKGIGADEKSSKQGSTNGTRSSHSHSSSPKNGKSSSTSAAAAAAAAKAAAANIPRIGRGGGGLWDEALMTLLGGPGPPDPFPEDSLPEFDGPAIDRQPAPGTGGRHGSRGRGGGHGADDGGRNGGSGKGGGSGGRGHQHLRSLSGEVVMWPTAPNDGRALDLRGWTNGTGGGGGRGYGSSNGNDVAPHHMKRWD